MVEHLNVDQREGGLQRARKDFVGVARLRDARGMVVLGNNATRTAFLASRCFYQ